MSLMEMFVENWMLILLFLSVALVYASAGFGGGSSYLAILTLWDFGADQIKVIALMCNIVVVTGSVAIYAKQGLYRNSKVVSLVALSTPLAFVGGYLRLEDALFYGVLGVTLVIAGLLTFWRKKEVVQPAVQTGRESAVIGGTIGFVSGLVGIGGGIFLSPYLHLKKYDTTVRIAAFSSLFILVNSVAGLAGKFAQNTTEIDFNLVIPLLIAVVIGGQFGVRLSLKKMSPLWIRRITAVLVLFVGAKILIELLMINLYS